MIHILKTSLWLLFRAVLRTAGEGDIRETDAGSPARGGNLQRPRNWVWDLIWKMELTALVDALEGVLEKRQSQE